MTNGEKLCIDFPNMRYTISEYRVITTIGVAASFDLDWWNAEYKEPSSPEIPTDSIIDWNNCHTSEQLDSIATTKNDLGVDCVSRNDVERIIERDFGSCWNENDYYDRLLADLEELPPVTPQEPKTGHWISDAIQGEIDGQIVKAFICSKCGAISVFRMTDGKIVNGDLCPNCGTKMVEPQESEEE